MASTIRPRTVLQSTLLLFLVLAASAAITIAPALQKATKNECWLHQAFSTGDGKAGPSSLPRKTDLSGIRNGVRFGTNLLGRRLDLYVIGAEKHELTPEAQRREYFPYCGSKLNDLETARRTYSSRYWMEKYFWKTQHTPQISNGEVVLLGPPLRHEYSPLLNYPVEPRQRQQQLGFHFASLHLTSGHIGGEKCYGTDRLALG